MRGSDSYAVGDFSAGAATAAGDYATNNRLRLAGAGGSAIGMLAGVAIAGPIGLIAGSFLGASAGKTSMRAVSGDPEDSSAKLMEGKTSGSEQNSGFPANSTLGGSNTRGHEVPDFLAPSNINDSTSIPGISSLASTTVEAELIGDVADVRHRTVMVQAQIIERPRTSFSGSDNQSTHPH
jgi:hypothetical protein